MNCLKWLEINLGALEHNVKQIKKVIGPSVSLIAVVKSNAYGHGLIPVSKKVLEAGTEWLAVFSLGEALRLRKAGIKAPILILGFVEKEGLEEVTKNGLSLALYDIETAKELSKLAKKLSKKAKIHLKIDTGMHRLGVLPKDVVGFIKELKKLKNIQTEAIFSHFAEATNKKYSLWQLKRFREILTELRQEGISLPLVHMANSAATLTIPESRFNLVRCGIAIYGLSPFLPNPKPALSFKAKIIHIKNLKKGDYVGYYRTYRAKKPIKIAVLGVGYADGYDRGLSNKGEVLVKGVCCPVIGQICMNQTIIDVSKLSEIRIKRDKLKIGDTVTLIGKDSDDRITVDEIAKKLKTISHEVVSRIPENIKRAYHE